jgi:hypothetical protein
MLHEPELAYVAMSVVGALWKEATTEMLRQQPDFWANVFQVSILMNSTHQSMHAAFDVRRKAGGVECIVRG